MNVQRTHGKSLPLSLSWYFVCLLLDIFCKPWHYLNVFSSRNFFPGRVSSLHNPLDGIASLIAKYSFKLWTPRSPSAASYVQQYLPSLFPPGPLTNCAVSILFLIAPSLWSYHLVYCCGSNKIEPILFQTLWKLYPERSQMWSLKYFWPSAPGSKTTLWTSSPSASN